MCHDTVGWCNIQRKIDWWFEKWPKQLINFYASSRKSENMDFDRFILSKAYKVSDEKVQKCYVSWHWKMIQRKGSSWEICICCVI